MTYTAEEIDILKDNTRQIEAYLRTLMPQFRETVTVEFGDTTTRRGMYGMPVRETEYELHVGKTCLCGHSGGLKYEFSEKDVDRSYAVSVYSNGFGTGYMSKLTRDWRTIKSKLLNALDKQTAETARLRSFAL